jgi:hypothetical protein
MPPYDDEVLQHITKSMSPGPLTARSQPVTAHVRIIGRELERKIRRLELLERYATRGGDHAGKTKFAREAEELRQQLAAIGPLAV